MNFDTLIAIGGALGLIGYGLWLRWQSRR